MKIVGCFCCNAVEKILWVALVANAVLKIVGCSCCSAFVFQDSRLLLLQCCFQDYVWVHQTPDDCNLFAVRKREKETGTTRERNQQGTHIDSQGE